MIKIEAIPAFNDNYLWLGRNQNGIDAFVVDPGDAAPVLKTLEKMDLNLTDILITHHHADHIGGVIELKAKYPNVNIYGPSTERFKHLVTHPCNDNESINLDSVGARFSVINLPGHTLDHIGYYTEGMVFVGDTLFSVGCGRLFEGSPEQMLSSLTKLAKLPKQTLVYCAHEYTLANIEFAECVSPSNRLLSAYKSEVLEKRQHNIPSIPTTIERQLAVNPFMRSHTDEIKTSMKNEFSLNKLPDDIESFTLLRKWKDNF